VGGVAEVRVQWRSLNESYGPINCREFLDYLSDC
jgi:hypothetical protein